MITQSSLAAISAQINKMAGILRTYSKNEDIKRLITR